MVSRQQADDYMVSAARRSDSDEREGLADERMGRIDDRDVLSSLIQE